MVAVAPRVRVVQAEARGPVQHGRQRPAHPMRAVPVALRTGGLVRKGGGDAWVRAMILAPRVTMVPRRPIMETTDPYLFLAMHQAKAVIRIATAAEYALVLYFASIVCHAIGAIYRAAKKAGQ